VGRRAMIPVMAAPYFRAAGRNIAIGKGEQS
jgi:hypothetical protein